LAILDLPRGFLASIGYLLAMGGVELAVGEFHSLPDLLGPDQLWRWLPPVGLGAALLLATFLGQIMPFWTQGRSHLLYQPLLSCARPNVS